MAQMSVHGGLYEVWRTPVQHQWRPRRRQHMFILKRHSRKLDRIRSMAQSQNQNEKVAVNPKP